MLPHDTEMASKGVKEYLYIIGFGMTTTIDINLFGGKVKVDPVFVYRKFDVVAEDSESAIKMLEDDIAEWSGYNGSVNVIDTNVRSVEREEI
ncbi:MAG: hypothetical protein ABGY11_11080 [Candidatus Thioglobus sp.]|jgi:hypothetical protein